ncbi:MAG: succinate dehydrogenase, hydrophobic membrane anchor protein [Pseudomonadota bacterium]
MVTQALSLTRSGLTDFIVQRVTAVILGAYMVVVLGFFLLGDAVTHARLVAFFGATPMQIFSTLAILSTLAHAWIGMWTIGTDYLRPAHVGAATIVRFIYQVGCLLALFVYLVWALSLIWL